MKCPNCKRELPVSGRFCGYCGAPLEPESQTVVADDKKKEEANADTDTNANADTDANVNDVNTDANTEDRDASHEETYATEYAQDSEKNITLIKTDMQEEPDICTQSSDPDQTEELTQAKELRKQKEEERSRKKAEKTERKSNTKKHRSGSQDPKKQNGKNETSKWIIRLSLVTVLLVAIIVVLAVSLFLNGKNGNWIASLSDLTSSQKTINGKTTNTYLLNDEFERMSVKATIAQTDAPSFAENGEKLLQIWIDDSLVYEVESGDNEKKEWTFAIDLRGVERMAIFTSDQVTLDDVQIIRQSAEKKTKSESAKDSNTKNNNSKQKQ